jgi:adenylate kinase family enzyme
VSARLGVPHIELDALNWRPGWVALHQSDPDFWSNTVAAAVSGEAWVTDGNYSKGAQPHILPRATDVVWLDYPRRVLLPRVIRRSLARAISGEELWPGTGNRETFARWLDKEHPIRWTWDTFESARATRSALFASERLAHARRHRLRHPREAEAWLRTLPTLETRS